MNTDYLLDLNSSLTQVLGENTNGIETRYLLGLDVLGQQTNNNWSYFGYDGLGSVRQLTDSFGVVRYNASYDPYGELQNQSGSLGSSLGFTGEQSDPNALLYLRARYMDPSVGAFVSRDPFEGYLTHIRWKNR